MSRLLPTRSIRRIEAAALAALPAGTLMDRAAAAVADATARLARTQAPGLPVLALVGPGNNGGDALLAALRLRERGYACRAVALHPEGAAHGDAVEAWRAARAAGLRIEGVDGLSAALREAPIVIDGLFGIGLDRALDGVAALACQALNEAARPLVAIDVPSGIDADTGAIVGGAGAMALRATHTVTMIADKPGLHTGAALDHVGLVQVAGLGLEVPPDDDAPPGAGRLFTAAQARAALQTRARDSNKGSFGSVLVYGGDTGTRGAVLLAARGAQALGAGKVFVATPAGELFDATQPQLMTAPADTGFAGFDAVAIGCGLGTTATARQRLDQALAGARALVLDADALNLLAAAAPAQWETGPRDTTGPPGTRVTLAARRVMTPHPLEAARLLGCDAAQVQSDRCAAALALARRFDMVALLKGAGSVVATPQGAWWIIAEGGPALATAGTGDVLAGMIAARLARGDDAAPAACLGAWLHGRSGTRWEQIHRHAEGLSAAELPGLVRETLSELLS